MSYLTDDNSTMIVTERGTDTELYRLRVFVGGDIRGPRQVYLCSHLPDYTSLARGDFKLPNNTTFYMDVMAGRHVSLVDFQGADFADTVWEAAHVVACNLDGADMSRVDFQDGLFNECSFRGTALPDYVPYVEDLDARIYEQICKEPELFDMSAWERTDFCGTTRCLGGWAVHFAGKQGEALVDERGYATAASLIYAKSTGSTPNFLGEGLREAAQRASKSAT